MYKQLINALFKYVLDIVQEDTKLNSIEYQMNIYNLHMSILTFIATTPNAVIILQSDTPGYVFKVEIDTRKGQELIKLPATYKLEISDTFESYTLYRKELDTFKKIN